MLSTLYSDLLGDHETVLMVKRLIVMPGLFIPTVAAALRARCASTADPDAGHDVGDRPMEGMDHGSPKPDAPPSEAPHAH